MVVPMRITDVGNNKNISKLKKKAESDKALFTDLLSETGTAEQSSKAVPAKEITDLNALLSLQEFESPKTDPDSAKRQGEEIMRQLDRMKMQLLEGTLSNKSLTDLSQLVSRASFNVADPRLHMILNDIKVRAAVELAKRGITL